MNNALQNRTTGRAKTRSDLARPSQRVAIFALCRWAGVDANSICAVTYRCRPVELSRGSADEFIGHLRALRPAKVA